MDLAHSNSCGHEKTISSTGDLCDSKVPFDKSDRRLNQRMGEVPWGVKHIIAGILFDLRGGYSTIFSAFVVLALACSLLVLKARAPIRAVT